MVSVDTVFCIGGRQVYKLKYTAGPQQNDWVEYTYSEVVQVWGGIATCQKQETVERLLSTGFVLIKEDAPTVKTFKVDLPPGESGKPTVKERKSRSVQRREKVQKASGRNKVV
jgi:hypothetical protein